MAFAAAVATMALLVFVANASDPELTTDFFVPVGVNKTTLTADYFTDITLRTGVTIVPPAKFGAKRVNSDSFPVLTGLGVSAALVVYLPGGINPPHTHPRGTEILAVMDGELTVGLIDSTNKLFTKVLKLAGTDLHRATSAGADEPHLASHILICSVHLLKRNVAIEHRWESSLNRGR